MEGFGQQKLVSLKYKLLKTIGKGSYGVVIKAQDRETKKFVAIKHIEDAFKDVDRFKLVVREVQILI